MVPFFLALYNCSQVSIYLSNNFSSGCEAGSFDISHIASIVGGTNNCFFCTVQIRTSVAMATYSSYRLIMGKVEIDSFFLSRWGYSKKKNYRNVY